MRRSRSTTIQPALESAETRILATAGISAHVAPHAAVLIHPAQAPHASPAPHAPSPMAEAVVSAEAHRPRKVVHHPAKAVHHPAAPSPSGYPAGPTSSGPTAPAPIVAEAWVRLQNETGSTVPYQISLAPYKGGQFLNFEIPPGYPNPVEYQYAGLTATGPGSVANFQIKFPGEEPVPLVTGPSEALAHGYYIFQDANGLYYVSPILA